MRQPTDQANRRRFWLLFALQVPATALLFLPFCFIWGTPLEMIQRTSALALTPPYALALPGLIAPFLAVMKLATLSSKELPRPWAWASSIILIWALAATGNCIPPLIDEGAWGEIAVAGALLVGGLAVVFVSRRRGLTGAPLFTALLILGYVPNAVLALLLFAPDLAVGGYLAVFASALYAVDFGLIARNALRESTGGAAGVAS